MQYQKIKMGKTYKGFRFKIDNKMRGCIGETDYEKKIVRINKKRAKKRKELGKTIYHETDHINHEQKHEKTVYKDEKRFPKISGKQKQRLYNLL